MKHKSGMYETTYGNTCKYRAGAQTAFDIDMGERIPLDMVDFDKPIKS